MQFLSSARQGLFWKYQVGTGAMVTALGFFVYGCVYYKMVQILVSIITAGAVSILLGASIFLYKPW